MTTTANINTVLSLESQSFLTGIDNSRGAIRRLIASLDPAAAAQTKFNRQMEMAEQALKRGQISTELYSLMTTRLRERLDEAVNANGRTTNSVGQMRAGMQQLSFQIGDVAQQFSTGTPALTIFAQQSGQVIQAVQMMSSTTGGFIGFLAGPWGAVLTGATMILGNLAMKYFDSSDAAKAKEKAARELKAAMDSLNQSTERQIYSEKRLQQASLQTALAFYTETVRAREATVALLRKSQADLRAQTLTVGSLDSMDVTPAEQAMALARQASAARNLTVVNKQLADAEAQVAKQLSTVRGIEIGIMRSEVAATRDRGTAATARYNTAVDRLTDSYRSGNMTQTEYRQQYGELTSQFERTKKEIEDSERKTRKASDATRGLTKEQRELARAAKDAARELEQEKRELQALLDRLNPDDAAQTRLSADMARLGEALAKKLISEDAFVDARRRVEGELDKLAQTAREKLATGLFGEQDLATVDLNRVLTDFRRQQPAVWGEIKAANDNLARSFEDMTRDITSSMRELVDGFRSGDAFSILDGITSLLSGISSTGLLGSGMQNAFANFRGFRADGGPVSAGMGYIVGERGPEWFQPGNSGVIVPNHKLGSGGGIAQIVPSPYFDVVVDGRVVRGVGQAAPGLIGASAGTAESRSAYRQTRMLGR